MRKVISLLIRICISAGVLLFLFSSVDTNKIIQAVSGIDKPILILVFLLFILIYFMAFLRWRTLLVGLGLDLPGFLIFRSFCIGYFSKLFLYCLEKRYFAGDDRFFPGDAIHQYPGSAEIIVAIIRQTHVVKAINALSIIGTA